MTDSTSSNPYPVEYYPRKDPRRETQLIRLLVVDDHAPFRDELCRFLEAEPDLAVCGVAGDAGGAARLAAAARPDVILIDLELTGGITLTHSIFQSRPQTRIILMSLDHDEDQVMIGLLAGAQANISKFSKPEQFTEAIRSVHRGEALMDSQTTARVLHELRSSYNAENPIRPR